MKRNKVPTGTKIVSVAILSALFVLAGCMQAPVQEEMSTIGGLFGVTGYAAFAGESSRDGMLMAIEQSGFEGTVVIEDFQSDFTTTANAANKLINVDQAPVIIGPEWEFGCVVSPLAAEEQALFISPWLTLETDCTAPELFMSSMVREQVYSAEAANYLAQQGVESVGLITSQGVFGATVRDTLTEALANNNIEVELFEVSAESTQFATQILQAAEHDVIYVVLQADKPMAQFASEIIELGVDNPVYIHYARGESDLFLDTAGEAVYGMKFVTQDAPSRFAEFSAMFEEKYGRSPAISAATSYDMTMLVVQAIESGARTPFEIKNYLDNVEPFEGYSGRIEFDNGFIATAPMVIKEVTPNGLVVIT